MFKEPTASVFRVEGMGAGILEKKLFCPEDGDSKFL
jgi:hypothetical protein